MLKVWAGEGEVDMADEKEPVTIKKYANRRLYNTGTSHTSPSKTSPRW